MILRGGYTTLAFMNAIESTIARREVRRDDPRALDRHVIENGGDGAIYLGGGYWRALPVWANDEPTRLVGVRLVNPDRTWAECRAVERGIALLCHLEYDDENPQKLAK